MGWVNDKGGSAVQSFKKGGKVKEKVKKEDFKSHVEEASSMDKKYSEYNRPKTSYEKTSEEGLEGKWKKAFKRARPPKRQKPSMESMWQSVGARESLKRARKHKKKKNKE